MATDRFDVIVVGTRAAGAATAMLLARAGVRVLAVDQARFPSDTVSTHQVQVPGVALLRRWGLLPRLTAVGSPPVEEVRLDAGPVILRGRYPTVDGVSALYSPRRLLLDAMLVEAAREAGAQVREQVRIERLLDGPGRGGPVSGPVSGPVNGPVSRPVNDPAGPRVGGVEGRDRSGRTFRAEADLVIGADGKHSLVAKAAGAVVRRHHPPRTFACYTYWSGVPLTTGELYRRPGRVAAAFPTDDGLTMVYTAGPAEDLATARRDPLAYYLDTLDRCGDLGERVRSGGRAERLRLAPDLPTRICAPWGSGWALAGDAGLVLDPISAFGITQAFRDAELLADGVVKGLDAGDLDRRLAGYERARDAAAAPLVALTEQLVGLRGAGLTDRLVLRALARDPAGADLLGAVLAGVLPASRLRSPVALARLALGRSRTPVALLGTPVGLLDRTRDVDRKPGHADTGHADTGHADTGHADTGYADTGHVDTGYDGHDRGDRSRQGA